MEDFSTDGSPQGLETKSSLPKLQKIAHYGEKKQQQQKKPLSSLEGKIYLFYFSCNVVTAECPSTHVIMVEYYEGLLPIK